MHPLNCLQRGEWIASMILFGKVLTIFSAGALLAGPAEAGGVVTNCTESNLLTAMVGGGTVTFACDGTITLASTISNTVATVLDGSGHQVTISGNNMVRVFYVNSNVMLTVNNLTIAKGRGPNGAGILNAGGTLNLVGVLCQSNTVIFGEEPDPALAGSGAGIFNRAGRVNATNCIFSSNAAVQPLNGNTEPWILSARGGAIRNDGGQVCLQNCVFIGNRAWAGPGVTFAGNIPAAPGAEAYGGAIHNSGSLVIDSCSFLLNAATGGGGGTNMFATRNYPEIGLAGGPGGSGYGGAICNIGTLFVSRTLFASNSVAGGMGSPAGPGASGWFATAGGSGGPGGSGYGGAVFNGGAATLVNCTVASNVATPAIGGQGGSGGFSSLSIGGSGGSGGNGGAAFGGLCDTNGMLTLTNCTVALNSASIGAGGLGGSGGSGAHGSGAQGAAGTYGIAAGGIRSLGATVVNSILSANNPCNNFGGSLTDVGHNLSSDDSCAFSDDGSMNSTNPKLGPLAGNGGLTFTMALLPGSPAINAGSSTSAPLTDQRGVTRPQGPGVDMGAFEYEYIPVFTGAGFQSVTNFWLQLSGLLPTQAFTLQASTNLTDWFDLTNFVAGASGVGEFVDLDSGEFTVRFYRLKPTTP